MKGFYIRWGALLGAAVILAVLALHYYTRHLASLTPEEVMARAPSGVVRVLGMVRGGTLTGSPETGRARFELESPPETLTVQYDGPPPENLRELKTLIVIGQWDPAARTFLARDIALVPNYGFVVGAYLAGMVPLAFFLFTMERKVGLLYRQIKQSKRYEAEAV